MPRLFQKRNGTWSEILSVFQKQGGTWTEILNIFQKIGGTWTKVFAAAKVPGNTVAPTITGSGYLYGTLTNTNLGTWTNTPTSYSRQWRRANPPAGGGEPQGYSNISGATSSTYVTTSDDNGKYVVCQVTATNALGSNAASSNLIYVSKYSPVALGIYNVTGGVSTGSTLTATVQPGTWKNTTDNTGDTYPDTFIFEWSDTNGNILQQTSSNTYLIASGDSSKTLRLRVKGTNTGGDAYTSYQDLGTVTSPYRFEFGKTLYVSSNGHIGLDSGSSSYTSMSSGRNIAIFVKDLQQYYLAEYSDSSVYYLFIKSYLYNSSASSVNALDYQIKFYNNPSIDYCDVYIVRKGSSVSANPDFATGYYSSGTSLSGFSGVSGSINAGTVFRVYFGSQTGTTSGISWTSVNDSLWDVIQTWTGQGAGGLGIDDTFTAVVSAANQQSPVPITPTTLTATTNDRTKIRLEWSGGSGTTTMFYYALGTATRPDNTTTSANFTTDSASPYDWTSMSRGTTYYFFVRSRNGTTPNFTYSTAWFPGSAPGVIGKAPLYAPGTPTSPSATANSTTQITFSWTAPTTPSPNPSGPDAASGYDIYYSTSTINPTSTTTPTTTSTTASKAITGLSASTQYHFWVRATNADNTGTSASSWTTRTSATTNAPAQSPSVTSIVGSTGGRIANNNWANPKATIVYNFANTTSATTRIQRSVDNITWDSGITEAASVPSYTQTTNQPVGTTNAFGNYYYRAQVISLNGVTLTSTTTPAGPITSASFRNTMTAISNRTLYP